MRSPFVRARSRTGTRMEGFEPERYVFMEASLRWHYPGQVRSGRQHQRCPLSPLTELPRDVRAWYVQAAAERKAMESAPARPGGLRYSHGRPIGDHSPSSWTEDDPRVQREGA